MHLVEGRRHVNRGDGHVLAGLGIAQYAPEGARLDGRGLPGLGRRPPGRSGLRDPALLGHPQLALPLLMPLTLREPSPAADPADKSAAVALCRCKRRDNRKSEI